MSTTQNIKRCEYCGTSSFHDLDCPVRKQEDEDQAKVEVAEAIEAVQRLADYCLQYDANPETIDEDLQIIMKQLNKG